MKNSPKTSYLDVYVNFGRSVKMARESRGMSQQDLAGILGMSRVNVSHFENGKQDIELKTALILSKLFNLSLDRLNFRMKVTVE